MLIKMWASVETILACSAFYLLYKQNTGDIAKGLTSDI